MINNNFYSHDSKIYFYVNLITSSIAPCFVSFGFRSLKSRVKVLVDGTLLIPNLIPEDAGNYSCIPTNGILTPPSASAHLKVKRKSLVSLILGAWTLPCIPWARTSLVTFCDQFLFLHLRPCTCGPNVPGNILACGHGGGHCVPCPGWSPCAVCQLDQRWEPFESWQRKLRGVEIQCVTQRKMSQTAHMPLKSLLIIFSSFDLSSSQVGWWTPRAPFL